MKKILVRPTEIESCWEKNDACFIKMRSGRVWICQKEVSGIPDVNQTVPIISTLETILKCQNDDLIELPLAEGGKHNGK